MGGPVSSFLVPHTLATGGPYMLHLKQPPGFVMQLYPLLCCLHGNPSASHYKTNGPICGKYSIFPRPDEAIFLSW